ncbi:hypothetical protein FOXYSP1_05408 [Fusarium oxysporum f. sp. phaseoli]
MFVLLVESYYLWIAISETVETWVHEENVLTTDRLVLKRSTYLAHASRYRWAAERIGLLSIEWKQTSPSRRQDQSISISIVQYSTAQHSTVATLLLFATTHRGRIHLGSGGA